MEQKELDRYRKLLEDKRAEILSEAERTLIEMTDQSGSIPDPNDRASAEADRNFELRIRDRERKLLPKIEDALKRIKDGTFGSCEGCGEEIGAKRLEARPVTSLCIDCKTLQEKNEKGHGAHGIHEAE
ncbi:MAG: RNA polymerase-binding protein DksA [Deltaproteobacteria bacterium]|nr:RNA polymerase-binding protein DksA [Deltaproteobacteria bacterium]